MWGSVATAALRPLQSTPAPGAVPICLNWPIQYKINHDPGSDYGLWCTLEVVCFTAPTSRVFQGALMSTTPPGRRPASTSNLATGSGGQQGSQVPSRPGSWEAPPSFDMPLAPVLPHAHPRRVVALHALNNTTHLEM